LLNYLRYSPLERCYKEHKRAEKRWGQEVAKRYVQRINILYACASTKDLSSFPQLRFHPLKGDLKGRYALVLVGRWRLIVSFDAAMQKVCIEEVSNHYDD
jgi:proteic killer suppression protein